VSIALTFVLVEQIGYLGIPLSKIVIDLLYFLPFGFVAIWIYCPQISREHIGRVAATSAVAALLPITVYFISGVSGRVSAYFPSIPALVTLIFVFAAIYSLMVIVLDRRVSFADFFQRA
jgi:hypothetical protein